MSSYATHVNPMMSQQRAVGVMLALAVLVGVIVLFYFLLKGDGENQRNTLENMEGVPSAKSTMAPVAQPAMVSLDGLASREIGYKGEDVRTNLSRELEDSSTSEYYPKVNLNPGAINIKANPKVLADNADRGNLVRNVRDLTRDQGVVQNVSVDGKKVPREIVKYGMFENHEFYPRTDQFPIKDSPHMFDPSYKPARSQFGPMTYPLVGPIGPLGMDYMRPGSRDTRVNIAATGGRH